jgi:glucan phosphorylase
MNSFSPHHLTPTWWVEIYTSVPEQTYRFGPFKSKEEAKLSRGTHVETLYHQEARDIVALIKQR